MQAEQQKSPIQEFAGKYRMALCALGCLVVLIVTYSVSKSLGVASVAAAVAAFVAFYVTRQGIPQNPSDQTVTQQPAPQQPSAREPAPAGDEVYIILPGLEDGRCVNNASDIFYDPKVMLASIDRCVIDQQTLRKIKEKLGLSTSSLPSTHWLYNYTSNNVDTAWKLMDEACGLLTCNDVNEIPRMRFCHNCIMDAVVMQSSNSRKLVLTKGTEGRQHCLELRTSTSTEVAQLAAVNDNENLTASIFMEFDTTDRLFHTNDLIMPSDSPKTQRRKVVQTRRNVLLYVMGNDFVDPTAVREGDVITTFDDMMKRHWDCYVKMKNTRQTYWRGSGGASGGRLPSGGASSRGLPPSSGDASAGPPAGASFTGSYINRG